MPPAAHQALALFHLLASDRPVILSRDRLGPDDLAFLKATRGLRVEAALRYPYDCRQRRHPLASARSHGRA